MKERKIIKKKRRFLPLCSEYPVRVKVQANLDSSRIYLQLETRLYIYECSLLEKKKQRNISRCKKWTRRNLYLLLRKCETSWLYRCKHSIVRFRNLKSGAKRSGHRRFCAQQCWALKYFSVLEQELVTRQKAAFGELVVYWLECCPPNWLRYARIRRYV